MSICDFVCQSFCEKVDSVFVCHSIVARFDYFSSRPQSVHRTERMIKWLSLCASICKVIGFEKILKHFSSKLFAIFKNILYLLFFISDDDNDDYDDELVESGHCHLRVCMFLGNNINKISVPYKERVLCTHTHTHTNHTHHTLGHTLPDKYTQLTPPLFECYWVYKMRIKLISHILGLFLCLDIVVVMGNRRKNWGINSLISRMCAGIEFILL